MKNKNALIGIAVACLLLAAVVAVKTLTGQDDAAAGKRMYLKCPECGHSIEMAADAYQKKMEEMTAGMDAMAIIAAQNLGLKCEKCGKILKVAMKNPQTGQIEFFD